MNMNVVLFPYCCNIRNAILTFFLSALLDKCAVAWHFSYACSLLLRALFLPQPFGVPSHRIASHPHFHPPVSIRGEADPIPSPPDCIQLRLEGRRHFTLAAHSKNLLL